jgi:hypothetical protein
MVTDKEDVREWFQRGKNKKQDYLIVIDDDFIHESYPVFTLAEDFDDKYDKYGSLDMTTIVEVYNLHEHLEPQVSQYKCQNFPPASRFRPSKRVQNE